MSYSVKVATAVLLVTLAALGVVAAQQLEPEAHHRDKRGIYYNSQAPVLIAAQVTIPISMAFPALKGRSARSGFDFNSSDVPYSYDDPLYRHQLNRMDLYFQYIGIDQDMCRQRFLCQIASSAANYSPLDEIFEKQLRDADQLNKSHLNRYFRYRKAMLEGKKSSGQPATCVKLYGTCRDDISDQVNLTVLKIMQYLTRTFKIKFDDTN